jgi:hypothetical protein
VIRAAWGVRARALRAATLARVVFALLVVASVGALFYSQVLKREDPLVLLRGTGGIRAFRPGGAGIQEAHLHITVSVNDVLEVSVLSARSGRRVAVLARGLRDRRYRRFRVDWNGRSAGGAPAPPGTYLVAVSFLHAGQTVTVPNLRLSLKGS